MGRAQEPLLLDSLNQAMAAKNNGGLVVVQARRRFTSSLEIPEKGTEIPERSTKRIRNFSFLWSFFEVYLLEELCN